MRLDLGDQMIHFGLAAVEFDDQQRFAIERVAGVDEGFGRRDRRPIHDLHSAGNDPAADHRGDAVAGALDCGEADEKRARSRRFRQDADGDLGDDAEHALGADHDAEQIVALRIEMLAAEPDDLAVDRHHFDADDVVGREPVFEAVHAARILGDVAADRAGDLARRVGRIVEPETLHGVGDAEIGHARLSDHAAVGDIDVEDLVELAHAEKNAVGERQSAARKRRSGAARDDLDLVGGAIAHDLDNLRRRLAEARRPWAAADRRSARRFRRRAIRSHGR